MVGVRWLGAGQGPDPSHGRGPPRNAALPHHPAPPSKTAGSSSCSPLTFGLLAQIFCAAVRRQSTPTVALQPGTRALLREHWPDGPAPGLRILQRRTLGPRT